MRSLTRVAVALGCVAVIGAPPTVAGDDEWKERLQSELEAVYRPSGQNFFGRTTSVGGVVVLQVDGLGGDKKKAMVSMNSVRDGQIVMQGGGGQLSGGGRRFKRGERFMIQRIAIKDDDVRFYLETVDTVDMIVSKKNIYGAKLEGETQAVKLIAGIIFEFPKGFLPTATVDDVRKAIRPILVGEDEAAAAPPQTISLGQTPDEVVAVLGKPDRKVELGPKTVLYFKDMKVIFQDGKVADVQ